jgi:hypothetical protein
VLRQPSLLARASEGLQGKVTAYADIFGEDVGQVSRQDGGRQECCDYCKCKMQWCMIRHRKGCHSHVL